MVEKQVKTEPEVQSLAQQVEQQAETRWPGMDRRNITHREAYSALRNGGYNDLQATEMINIVRGARPYDGSLDLHSQISEGDLEMLHDEFTYLRNNLDADPKAAFRDFDRRIEGPSMEPTSRKGRETFAFQFQLGNRLYSVRSTEQIPLEAGQETVVKSRNRDAMAALEKAINNAEKITVRTTGRGWSQAEATDEQLVRNTIRALERAAKRGVRIGNVGRV